MTIEPGYNPTEKELKEITDIGKELFGKYDYPFSPRLIKALEAEYRKEAKTKGNTWRNACTTDYLVGKLIEEVLETLQAYNKRHSLKTLQSELIDQILIASMLFERLEDEKLRQSSRKI